MGRCLVETTGSCRGCNVLSLVGRRVNRGESRKSAATEVARQLCPSGNKPQTEALERRRSCAMGQPDSTGVVVE